MAYSLGKRSFSKCTFVSTLVYLFIYSCRVHWIKERCNGACPSGSYDPADLKRSLASLK